MTGLSCLTFVLVAFCCYALSSSKPARNEASAKKLDLTQNPQQHQQQHQQTHHQDDGEIHSEHELKTETRHKRSQLDMGGSAAGGVFGAGAGEYKDFNEFLEELGDNALLQSSLISQSQEAIDVDNMSPLVYYMLVQKIKQMQNNERQLPTRRTPRLGRSIDFQLFDAAAGTGAVGGANSPLSSRDFDGGNALVANDYAAISRQFLPHIMKKSVQFKPRLGKRTQVCD